MQKYTELKVWQRSHALVISIYQITAIFPSMERFGLISQIRRSAMSVPTNIAEGSKRKHSLDYARFLNHAESSLSETGYLILLSRDLNYLSSKDAGPILKEVEEIGKMLYSLRTKVETANDS